MSSDLSFTIISDRKITRYINGLKEGLHQYYEIEQTTDLWSFNTGRVQAKMGVNEDILHILFQERISLEEALVQLKDQFGCERLTVQSGGTVNCMFLREKLLDYVDIIAAPVLIGGKDTATLIDGPSLREKDELSGLGVLRLIDVCALSEPDV